MDLKKEEMYRLHLMRQIGERMQGFAYVNKDNVKSLYNLVYESFAKGKNGSTYILESIRTHKKENGNCPVYGYFDLSTLYAFHRYVDDIVKNMATCLRFYNKVPMEEFEKCVENSTKKFIENSRKSSVAWYDASTPITVAKTKAGYNPLKTLTVSQYLKRYANDNENLSQVDSRIFDEIDEIMVGLHKHDNMPPKSADKELEVSNYMEFFGIPFQLLENSSVLIYNPEFKFVTLKKFYNNDYGMINLFYDMSTHDIYKITDEDSRRLEKVGDGMKINIEQPIAYYPNQNGRKNIDFAMEFENLYGRESICPNAVYSTIASTRLNKDVAQERIDPKQPFGKPTNNGEQMHLF